MVSVVGMVANDITACSSKALSVRASVVLAAMLPVITEVMLHCAEEFEPALKSDTSHCLHTAGRTLFTLPALRGVYRTDTNIGQTLAKQKVPENSQPVCLSPRRAPLPDCPGWGFPLEVLRVTGALVSLPKWLIGCWSPKSKDCFSSIKGRIRVGWNPPRESALFLNA